MEKYRIKKKPVVVDVNSGDTFDVSEIRGVTYARFGDFRVVGLFGEQIPSKVCIFEDAYKLEFEQL